MASGTSEATDSSSVIVQAEDGDIELTSSGEDCASFAATVAAAFATRGVTVAAAKVAAGAGLLQQFWWPGRRCIAAAEGGRVVDTICAYTQQPWWVPTGALARKFVKSVTGGQINVCYTEAQGGGGTLR